MPKPNSINIHKVASYDGHTGSVFSMAIDEPENYLYTSGDDGIVAQWDLDTAEGDAVALLRSDRAIYSIGVSDKHQLLFAGSSDGTLYICDLKGKKLLDTRRKNTEAIYHLEVKEDTLWICQAKGFLSAINLTNGKEILFTRLSEENLRIMVPALEEGQYFIGASDSEIYLIDEQQARVTQQWKAHDNSVFSLMIHPDGKYLLSGSRDAHFNVWDLQDNLKRVRHIPAHNFTVNYFALSPDGNYFLTASRDKTIKLWDAYDFSLLKVIDFARNQAHTHSVNKIYWLKKDQSFVSCGDDRRVLRWKMSVEK